MDATTLRQYAHAVPLDDEDVADDLGGLWICVGYAAHDEFETASDQVRAHWLAWAGIALLQNRVMGLGKGDLLAAVTF